MKRKKEYPAMSWVFQLPQARNSVQIYIGPCPTSADHMGHLMFDLHVNGIISLDPSLKDKYMPKLVEGTSVVLIEEALDMHKFKAKGRDEDAKRNSLASFYIACAERIFNRISTKENANWFLHLKNGNLEEVFIGFALIYLLCPKAQREERLPADPCEWIRENGYERLLDDDFEHKQTLQVIWHRIKQLAVSREYFPIVKKIKKST